MARPKLDPSQRAILLHLLTAGYSESMISMLFDRQGWPVLTSATLAWYRKHYEVKIRELRATRYAEAMTTGLGVREERIQRLKDHADALELIKFVPDKHGRLVNEKAWRECLHQIAEETGDLSPLRDQDVSEIIVRFAGKNRPPEPDGQGA